MTYHFYWLVVILLYENVVRKCDAYRLRRTAWLKKHVKILLDYSLGLYFHLMFLYFTILFILIPKKRLLNIPEIDFIIAIFIGIAVVSTSLLYLYLWLKFFIRLVFFYEIVPFSYSVVNCLVSQLPKLFFAFLIALLNCFQISTDGYFTIWFREFFFLLKNSAIFPLLFPVRIRYLMRNC